MNRFRFRVTWVLQLGLLGGLSTLAGGAEPAAARRLPDQTVAYLSVNNTAELAQRLQQTALGHAFRDPQVRPLIEHLWSSVVPTLEQFEAEMGMGLDELATAVPGQLVLALVNIPAFPPAGVIMFRPHAPERLAATLEQGRGRLVELGFAPSSDSIEGAEARILTRDEGPLEELVQLRLDDWQIIATDRQVAGAIVALWQGEPIPSLSDHAPYQTIMSRCALEGSSSQLDWYVDPIATARALTRGNLAAAAAMAFLPALGADGLQAVGGRVTVADEHYDLITRTHLLLEPPREGMFKLLALRQGSSDPEAWVPADVANYITWQWDLQQAFDELRGLVDSFRGEGALAGIVKRRFSDPLGVDLEREVLPRLAGRITQIVRFERPASLTSQSTAVGIELTDAAAMQPLWTKLVEKFSDRIEKTNFAGIDVYRWKREATAAEATVDDSSADPPPSDDPAERRRERRRQRRQQAQQRWRQSQPVAAFLGDYLIIADRPALIEQIIMTYDDAQPRLKDELDYKLVVSKLKRHSSTGPGMIRFERPEEGLEVLYQLLYTEDVRQQVHEQRERHPFFGALDELLSENRLPPFEVLSRYLAPGGSALVNEESGFYHVSFGLRRQIESPLGQDSR